MYLKRLRDLREDNDYTQEQIGDYLCCNRQVYSRYERGLRELPIEYLDKLADLYNTSADYILGKTDVVTPYPKKTNK